MDTAFTDESGCLYALDTSERSRTPHTCGTLYRGPDKDHLSSYPLIGCIQAKKKGHPGRAYYIDKHCGLTTNMTRGQHQYAGIKLTKIRKGSAVFNDIEERVQELCDRKNDPVL